jgi:hypothetical protein
MKDDKGTTERNQGKMEDDDLDAEFRATRRTIYMTGRWLDDVGLEDFEQILSRAILLSQYFFYLK